MATRNIIFSQGEYYHIYNRGVEKKVIFKDDKDRDYFIRSLYFSLDNKSFKQQLLKDISIGDFSIKKKSVSIGAYVLMSNHFHILVKVKNEKDFSIFMNKLQTSYAMYFNQKYEHNGRVFQGTFKAKHVTNDQYLKYLFAYIHLNPIKQIYPMWKSMKSLNINKIKQFLSTYEYSSMLDYSRLATREQGLILDKNAFPNYFKKTSEFNIFTDFWIKYKDEFLQGNPVKKY